MNHFSSRVAAVAAIFEFLLYLFFAKNGAVVYAIGLHYGYGYLVTLCAILSFWRLR